MIVTTTENIPGARVVQTLGEVFGLTVRTRGLGGNIAAGFRSIVGGEVGAYVKLLEDARRQAVDRMVQSATAMGQRRRDDALRLLGDRPVDERNRRLRHGGGDPAGGARLSGLRP